MKSKPINVEELKQNWQEKREELDGVLDKIQAARGTYAVYTNFYSLFLAQN